MAGRHRIRKGERSTRSLGDDNKIPGNNKSRKKKKNSPIEHLEKMSVKKDKFILCSSGNDIHRNITCTGSLRLSSSATRL